MNTPKMILMALVLTGLVGLAAPSPAWADAGRRSPGFARSCSRSTVQAAGAFPAWQGHGQGRGEGQGEEHGHGHGKGQGQGHGQPAFTVKDRQMIRAYFSENPSGLPPGLAKRGGNLPPGLQKQLARNGTLPPGLQKRLQPLPVELERRLPPLPPDYERGFIGASIVIYNRKTAIIADIVSDVIALTR